MSFSVWINAFRLRTLPLAFSSIITGVACAAWLKWDIILLALLTTALLQILSNLANDLGDTLKGSDNEHRIGPVRAVQSGAISVKQMKTAVATTALLSFISGVGLLWVAFGGITREFLIFMAFGFAAIFAAITYTLGKKAYGYYGLGDVFVFLFFGLLGVTGTFYLIHHSFPSFVFEPAVAIGLLSAGVLNLNNMRDIENDKNSGKNTLAVKLGAKNAKVYHSFLLIGAFLSLAYTAYRGTSLYLWLFAIGFIPVFIHLKKVWTIKTPRNFDLELKKLALSTFLISLLFAAGVFWS
ncbi:MAG: 1,4-dihydroxy-2-naphthoate polyprenyltransferase [Flavobacteriales bacterium]